MERGAFPVDGWGWAELRRFLYICIMGIRQEKVGNVIKRELGTLFQREASSLCKGAMVSVTIVRMSPDLGAAKVYVSLFATPDKEALLDHLQLCSGEIRHKLAKIVRHQLRVVPHLNFYLDDSLDYAERIDDLLK